jgi:dTDP-4-dehydrorhamnose reductase
MMADAPRSVVLGAAGQLGRELMQRLSTGAQGVLRTEADLSVPGQITLLLRKLRPRVVLNCAAYNLVDQAEDEPDPAFATNAAGVRELALACREVDATLVHFSTDYVFGADRSRTSSYGESAAPGPVSTYGISKLTGEYFTRAYASRHFIIRTCGLYGRHGAGGKGGNFVETMLRLAQGHKPIRVVNDQILTPSSAADVAQGALELIERCPPGLYHLTNRGACSWFEFAVEIFRLAGIQAEVQPISSAAYGSKAMRPSFSVLHSENPATPRLRPWNEALQDYLATRRLRMDG